MESFTNFQKLPLEEFSPGRNMLTLFNPPYGERLGEEKEVRKLMKFR